MTIKEVTAYTTSDGYAYDLTSDRDSLVDGQRREVFEKYITRAPTYVGHPSWYSYKHLWKKQRKIYEDAHEEGYKYGHREGVEFAQQQMIKFYDQIMAELKEIK